MSKICRFRGLVFVFVLILLCWADMGTHSRVFSIACPNVSQWRKDQERNKNERERMFKAERLRQVIGEECENIRKELTGFKTTLDTNLRGVDISREHDFILKNTRNLILNNSLLKARNPNLLEILVNNNLIEVGNIRTLQEFLDKCKSVGVKLDCVPIDSSNTQEANDLLKDIKNFSLLISTIKSKLGTLNKDTTHINGALTGLELRLRGLEELRDEFQKIGSNSPDAHDINKKIGTCRLKCENLKKKSMV